jgi:hypothetical protein
VVVVAGGSIVPVESVEIVVDVLGPEVVDVTVDGAVDVTVVVVVRLLRTGAATLSDLAPSLT